MLAERGEQLGAEEAASGEPSIWASVYRTFRCPSHPCQLGPYCWIRPNDRKHYKLLGQDVETLAEYKQQGHVLESHEHMYIYFPLSLHNCYVSSPPFRDISREASFLKRHWRSNPT
jgi:hypothetical protein